VKVPPVVHLGTRSYRIVCERLKRQRVLADREGAVNINTWKFERDTQRLEVARHETEDGWRLVLTCSDTPRSYSFSSLDVLTRFQSDMEAFLLKTGWRFLGFSPERRRGCDRRTFPRVQDRRRWWSDGTADMSKAVWGG